MEDEFGKLNKELLKFDPNDYRRTDGTTDITELSSKQGKIIDEIVEKGNFLIKQHRNNISNTLQSLEASRNTFDTNSAPNPPTPKSDLEAMFN